MKKKNDHLKIINWWVCIFSTWKEKEKKLIKWLMIFFLSDDNHKSDNECNVRGHCTRSNQKCNKSFGHYSWGNYIGEKSSSCSWLWQKSTIDETKQQRTKRWCYCRNGLRLFCRDAGNYFFYSLEVRLISEKTISFF